MSDKYNDIFPTRLRQLIEEKPTTITAVARELGISRQAVSQYTMGIGQPNADKLLQIAEYFDVSCDWLVGRQGGAKSFDINMDGVCRFLNMSEESVTFLRKLGQFAEDYPGTIDALFASKDFREVMKSMLKYRFSHKDRGMRKRSMQTGKRKSNGRIQFSLNTLLPRMGWEMLFGLGKPKSLGKMEAFPTVYTRP